LAITAVLYGAITGWKMDFKALGPAFVESIKTSLDATLANKLVDDARIIHVDFRTLTRDPVAVIRHAYETWDKPFTAIFETKMRTWLTDPANRPDRYGRCDKHWHHEHEMHRKTTPLPTSNVMLFHADNRQPFWKIRSRWMTSQQ
jgi:hypothetical protein